METRKREEKNKYNTIPMGFFIGLLVPAITLLLFWYAKYYPTTSLSDFFTTLFKPEVIMKIVSLCALPDLLVFYIMTKKDMMLGAKGMIGSIIFLIVITIIVKL
ncbi:MAG: hypothetical protein MJ211_09185 [Bacteroidales bacterium]|nr:hypothetical protein [Bacteroidales bacterium]